MNPRRWFQEHSLRLLAIRDTPEAIAGGIAIGIFFGFTPLFGLKTLAAILFAWLTRSNIIAAVIASAMHDLALPFMPIIYQSEYSIGYWLLSKPHQWPPSLLRIHWHGQSWSHWTTFLLGVGRPLLVGSVICSAPVSLVCFALAKIIVTRHQKKEVQKAAEKVEG